MCIKRTVSALLVLFLMLSLFPPSILGHAGGDFQTDLPALRAQSLLAKLSPEERVGQLFLVTFMGTSVDETSQIYELIANRHVGGVVLLASNDNFVASPQTIPEAHHLIAQLQTIENQAALTVLVDLATGEQKINNYIPLFVGISQDGDGYPDDQILSGLTPMPNLMAIGATWQPALARQVGIISGQELSALGFNLFLGPSLDVVESPAVAKDNDLGPQTFGGDPYWVGEMGQAYISGLHEGSSNRMVVVAKHFPGRGSSDRPYEAEVATVRKSLEQLKQIELAPFFAITGNSPNPQSTADGLLVSHIRYQGFQGNIRATTRPVSFDSQALSQILALPAFTPWRENGGLIVSDDLGSQVVRQFYDPVGNSFSARLVVRDAFLAGNDLLYLGDIISADAVDNYDSVLRILDFFAQKYREDTAFAQRVDESVTRILTYKFRLYGEFDFSTVIPPEGGLQTIGQSQAATFDIARQAATLISPDPIDLDAVLPAPPDMRERLLFITDTRTAVQCSTCPEISYLDPNLLPEAILRLYGPLSGGQVVRNRLFTYSFEDLALILEGGAGYPTLESNIRQMDWIIISILDVDSSIPQTTAIHRFLSERQDLLRNKKVVVFSFNAPYYLDATDISKITAYYGLYSKSLPFVEMAARLLFQEITPIGSLPVSLPGIGYDLLSATSPNPNQVIELYLDLPPVPTPAASATPEATPTPFFRVGDNVSVRTGVILDHNNRPVPDGTGVRFSVSLSGEAGALTVFDTSTVHGVARAVFSIDRPGLLEIRAISEPATTSVVIQLDVTSEGVLVTVIAPTQSPVSESAVPPLVPTREGQEYSSISEGYPGASSWIVMIMLIAVLGYFTYWLGSRLVETRWGLRWGLCLILGGLLAYNYLAFSLPGGRTWIQAHGLWGILGVVAIGALAGLAAGLVWYAVVTLLKKRSG